MAELKNLVRVATATTGTGTIVLGDAVDGGRTFAQAGIANGTTVSYAIEDNGKREVGRGVYNAGTLTRGLIDATNDTLLSLSGKAKVSIDILAEDIADIATDVSGKADLTGATFTGVVQFGTAPPQGSDPAFLHARTITTAAVSPHAFSDSAALSFGSNLAYNSFEARFQVSGTGGYNHFAGFQVNPLVATSGTTTNFWSFFAAPIFDTGTVTNAYGYYVYPYRGTGAVTNAYGLYVSNLDRGTNRWAIFQEGASDLNYFAGGFGIANRTRITGDAHVPTTGAGLELAWNAAYNAGEGIANVFAFDRAAGVFKKLYLAGSDVFIAPNGAIKYTFGATTADFTTGLALANRLRITTDDWVPASGKGLEAAFNETFNAGQGAGLVFAYDRTGGAYLPFYLGGLTTRFLTGAAGTVLMTGKETELTLAAGKAIRLGGDTGPTISAGTGTPESSVTAPVGSLWLRTNGGTDTAVYRKETGSGNTGWVALAAGGGGGSSAPPLGLLAFTTSMRVMA